MEHFANSFILTMLHSVWQMAVLLLLYMAANVFMQKRLPIVRRNLLLLLLGGQFLLSIISFLIIYFRPGAYLLLNISQLPLLADTPNAIQYFSNWFFYGYTAVCLYKAVLAMMGWRRFGSIQQAGWSKPPIHIREFTKFHAELMGIRQKVQVWYSEHIQSPLVFGFLKPVILLPLAISNHLSIAQTEALIIHELSHIKQQDFALNWFLLLIETLFWFNPFVKIAIQKIKIEREKNCDMQVLQFKYPALSYAEALLWIARQPLSTERVQVSLNAVGKQKELLHRIQYFSSTNPGSKKTGAYLQVLAILLMSMMVVFQYHLSANNKSASPSGPAVVKLTERSLFISAATPQWVDWNTTLQTASVAAAPETTIEINNTAAPKFPQQSIFSEKNPSKESKKINLAHAIPVEDSFADEGGAITGALATNVAFVEAQLALKTKDLILEEQGSNGSIKTTVYKLYQTQTGEWKLATMWISTEQPITDSLRLRMNTDTTVVKIFPTVQ